jgi:hypothetical protein
MPASENLEALYVVTAILFQIVLIIHFALRKWSFNIVVKYGWIVYALSLPAAVVSMILMLGGVAWSLWLGGFIYLIWAIYGYTIEFVQKIKWRNPPRWPVLIPYVFLYLATVMFYWWPLALVSRRLWYLQAVMFVISTILNLTSHKRAQDANQAV